MGEHSRIKELPHGETYKHTSWSPNKASLCHGALSLCLTSPSLTHRDADLTCLLPSLPPSIPPCQHVPLHDLPPR
ncbi:hypothetical protein E2C01_084241 [Portunus trituberculatus]|uniref:Uncharacterized protein n=1 Tax=Portunus trituberculatus TaxID=210409 RepID=A0A5B7IUS1_PORTR|nr:hypothetical protein [Portunus trituberculatus]